MIEYTILPASAAWSWVIWGEVLSPIAVLGMAMIVAAGIWIALKAEAKA